MDISTSYINGRRIYAVTDRLLLGELIPADAEGMFILDSDPEVHRYLGDPVVKDVETSARIIEMVRKQYKDNGVGRWAVLDRISGEFMGWSGLKLEKGSSLVKEPYYDLGYRFIRKFWGKGYATESAFASVSFGFITLKLDEIYAEAEMANKASLNVISKCRFRHLLTYDDEGYQVGRFRLRKEKWQNTGISY